MKTFAIISDNKVTNRLVCDRDTKDGLLKKKLQFKKCQPFIPETVRIENAVHTRKEDEKASPVKRTSASKDNRTHTYSTTSRPFIPSSLEWGYLGQFSYQRRLGEEVDLKSQKREEEDSEAKDGEKEKEALEPGSEKDGGEIQTRMMISKLLEVQDLECEQVDLKSNVGVGERGGGGETTHEDFRKNSETERKLTAEKEEEDEGKNHREAEAEAEAETETETEPQKESPTTSGTETDRQNPDTPCLQVTGEQVLAEMQNFEANAISVMHELSKKVSRVLNFVVRPIPVGKTFHYHTMCLLDKEIIGEATATSKQIAKNSSASNAIRAIVDHRERFSGEFPPLLGIVEHYQQMFIERKKKAEDQNQNQINDNRNDDAEAEAETETERIGKDESGKHKKTTTIMSPSITTTTKKLLADSNAPMNGSAIYELHLIAISNSMSLEFRTEQSQTNHTFSVWASLDDGALEVSAHGASRKIQAKREAAERLLRRIKEDPELMCKYDFRRKQHSTKEDEHTTQFLETVLLRDDEIPEPSLVKTSIVPHDVTRCLYALVRRSTIASSDLDRVLGLFRRLSQFLQIATSLPRQILMDAPLHLGDHLADCALVPAGDFALNCLSSTALIEAVVYFTPTARFDLSDRDFLCVLRDSFHACWSLSDDHASEGQSVLIEICERSGLLVIHVAGIVVQLTLCDSNHGSGGKNRPQEKGKIKNRRVQAQSGHEYESESESESESERENSHRCSSSRASRVISHIRTIYTLLQEDLLLFGHVSLLLRNWRRNHDSLLCLDTAILDLVILTESLRLGNAVDKLAQCVFCCLLTLSCEETLFALLAQYQYESSHSCSFINLPFKFRMNVYLRSTAMLQALLQTEFSCDLVTEIFRNFGSPVPVPVSVEVEVETPVFP